MRALILAFLTISALAHPAAAFCGFYVAKADADLFNQASKVVYMRDGDRSVITMVSDYEGEPAEFAMVIPTPSVLSERQIHVTDPALVDHLGEGKTDHRVSRGGPCARGSTGRRRD